VAQQGPPPRRPSGRAGSRDRGDERPGQDRVRRADRAEAQNWRQLEEAFRPDADNDLPPWAAGLSSDQRGMAGAPRRAARTRLSDPYADVPAPAAPQDDAQTGYRGRRRGASSDVDTDPGPGAAIATEPEAGLAGPEERPVSPAAPPRRLGRGRGRAAAARLRRSRRRVVLRSSAAILVCVIGAVVALVVTHHPAVKAPYVTRLQSGEYKAVPDACASVTAATLTQYLPGAVSKSDELSGPAESECSFTVDHKPVFLVLEVTAQQYAPFAAATGDGSATANAQDNFTLTQFGLTHRAKGSPLTAATISPLAGTGQQAIVGVQTEKVGNIATDLVTVLVRERNAVITVLLSGQESGHGFGPVSLATLEAGATAAAKDVLARLSAEPAAA
jgi:hypothetical protein